MPFRKLATSAAVIASLLAANLSPLATAANAREGWRKDYDRGYARQYDAPRYAHGPRHRYGYKRDRHGKDIGKGIAIGLGILAVGAILSSAHNH